MPAANAAQTEAQRGNGVWETSIAMIRRLNGLGYGTAGSGLELDLVSNPTGAFLPAPQAEAEKRFRLDLERRYAISFNHLYTFANVPLGRFRAWLERSGNLDAYLARLEGRFNPCTLPGLMCRSLISVNWDGFIYDCDFNLAAGLHHGASGPISPTSPNSPRQGPPSRWATIVLPARPARALREAAASRPRLGRRIFVADTRRKSKTLFTGMNRIKGIMP